MVCSELQHGKQYRQCLFREFSTPACMLIGASAHAEPAMRPAAPRAAPQAAPAAADEAKLRDFGSSPIWSTTALAAGIRPFAGEREMWTSYSPEAARKRQLRSRLATVWLLVSPPHSLRTCESLCPWLCPRTPLLPRLPQCLMHMTPGRGYAGHCLPRSA